MRILENRIPAGPEIVLARKSVLSLVSWKKGKKSMMEFEPLEKRYEHLSRPRLLIFSWLEDLPEQSYDIELLSRSINTIRYASHVAGLGLSIDTEVWYIRMDVSDPFSPKTTIHSRMTRPGDVKPGCAKVNCVLGYPIFIGERN